MRTAANGRLPNVCPAYNLSGDFIAIGPSEYLGLQFLGCEHLKHQVARVTAERRHERFIRSHSLLANARGHDVLLRYPHWRTEKAGILDL